MVRICDTECDTDDRLEWSFGDMREFFTTTNKQLAGSACFLERVLSLLSKYVHVILEGRTSELILRSWNLWFNYISGSSKWFLSLD